MKTDVFVHTTPTRIDVSSRGVAPLVSTQAAAAVATGLFETQLNDRSERDPEPTVPEIGIEAAHEELMVRSAALTPTFVPSS